MIRFRVSSITEIIRGFVPEKVKKNKTSGIKKTNNTLRKCENKFIPFCAAISSRTLVIQVHLFVLDLEGKVHSSA